MEVGVEEVGGKGEGPSAVASARERLLRLGTAALTDRELVALVVGAKGFPPRLDEALLGPGLRAIALEDPESLCASERLGAAAGAQLLAAIELGRRVQRSAEKRPKLKTPKEIYRYLSPALAAQRREEFHVLSFNSRNVLLRDTKVAQGTVNACPVDPREVFASAIAARATAIVLAHNHPSGDPEPSAEDLALTEQIFDGGRLLGIGVLDHVVVGDGSYVSLLERNLMPRRAA